MAGRLLPLLCRAGSCQLRLLRTPGAGHRRGLQSLVPSSSLCLLKQSVPSVLPTVCQDRSLPPSTLHVPARCYSKKGKDKGGKGKKDKGRRAMLSDEELSEVIDPEKLHSDMHRLVEKLKHDYLTQLSLRITTGTFDSVVVTTPEGRYPLNQLGQIIQKSPDRIHINMASSPQYLSNVRDAIVGMQLNVTPQVDGTSIFIQIPKLTKEHREHLAKSAKTYCDKAKDQLRDVYKKYVKKKFTVPKVCIQRILSTVQKLQCWT